MLFSGRAQIAENLWFVAKKTSACLTKRGCRSSFANNPKSLKEPRQDYLVADFFAKNIYQEI
jgi:hypothetical protein